jgi:KipI family sensor histidine kinase inhibitor
VTGNASWSLRVRPLGDRALIAELLVDDGDGARLAMPGPEATRRTLAFAQYARVQLGSAAVDIVPAYRSVLIEYDPDLTTFDLVRDAIQGEDISGSPGSDDAGRTVTIPVLYGGEAGPDLEDVAAHAGLPIGEVIARHAGGDYRVAFLGFSPGYAYLQGLPPELATPRLGTPRARVPAGSVAIGGAQTGIYPQATPGGWRIVGQTPVAMFDPACSPGALLGPGDRVAFRPIDRRTFHDIAARVRAGTYAPETVDATGAPVRIATNRLATSTGRGLAALEVVAPGLITTVQDRGRPGRGAEGVSPGGALDRSAAAAANRLVGNGPDAALLEIGVTGPTLRALRPVDVAVAGADLGATVAGRHVSPWSAVRLRPGETLAFDPALATRSAMRAYLAVAGGIDVPVMLGGRGTDLTAGFGGVDGRPLRAGDVLRVGPAGHRSRTYGVVGPRPREYGAVVTLRIVVGPNDDLIAPGDLERLLGEPYRVTSQSSHMGVRLSGPGLTVAGAGDLVSEGIMTGTLQIPADGQPIILLAGRGTVGGYAKVAGVIDADLDLCAQLRPDTLVRFQAVTLTEATVAGRAYRERLRWLTDDIVAMSMVRAVKGRHD